MNATEQEELSHIINMAMQQIDFEQVINNAKLEIATVNKHLAREREVNMKGYAKAMIELRYKYGKRVSCNENHYSTATTTS